MKFTLPVISGCSFLRHLLILLIWIIVLPITAQNNNKNALSLFSSEWKRIENNARINNQEIFLNINSLNQLLSKKQNEVEITIPSMENGEIWTIQLTKNEVVTKDFKVRTSDGKNIEAASIIANSVFYKGKIAGQTSSLVALSIFENDVMGVISIEGKTYDIGKFGNTNRYVMVNANEVSRKIPFTCETSDETPMNLQSTQALPPSWNCTRIFRMYFECDYDFYTKRQSNVTNVVNFVTGMYNVVNTIFANESIVSQISEIFVWTTTDPFATNSSSSNYLNAYRTYRTSFNGDLAHLLSTRNTNYGGIAYLTALCSPSVSYAYSNINNSYNNFPSYSWTINVVTHEIGHNLGSPHTHACSWPGGAIDNCYTTEGGCATGPVPVNGGTIMSYCHLTSTGVNFNNGFGPLPGNLIRNSVTNSLCLNVSPNSSSIPLSCSPTTSNPNNTTYSGPTRVVLNTIDNYSSAANVGPFQDFTCNQTTDLVVGGTYSIWVTTGATIQNVRAYIDFNANGNFETNELILTVNGTSTYQTVSNTFTVPLNAQIDTWLRMRVVSDVNTNPEPLQACSNLLYGQAEDYRISILSAGFYPGEITVADENICSPADPNNITFSVNAFGSGSITRQWYSFNGIATPSTINGNTTNWTLINGATSNTYNPPAGVTTNTSYACLVSMPGFTSRWAIGSRKITINVLTFVGYLNQGNQTFTGSGDPSVITLAGGEQGGGTIGGPQTEGFFQWYSAPGIQQQAPTGTTVPSNWTAIPGATSSSYDPPVQNATISYALMIDPIRQPDCTGFTWAFGVRQITIIPQINPGVLSAGNQTFCATGGDPSNITFSTLPSGASVTFQWYSRAGIVNAPTTDLTSNWNFISGANTNSYDPPAGLTQSTTYACFVTPTGGTGLWANGARQITILPVFQNATVTAGDQTLCSPADPANITLSNLPVGSGGFTYQWYFINQTVNCPLGNNTAGWSLISGATNTNFDPAAGATTTNRTFAVMVTPIASGTSPACGAAQWANNCRKIFVPPVLNRGTLTNGNQSINTGGDPSNITFSTQPVGSGSFSFQWYQRDGVVAAPTGNSLTGWNLIQTATTNSYDPPSGLTVSRTYACFVTPIGIPTCGTAGWATGARQITVNTVVGNVNYGTLAAGNQTLCATGGDPAIINFSTAPSGAIGFNYQWYFQNGNVAAPTGSNLAGWTTINLATSASYDPPAGLTQTRTYACFVSSTGSNGQWASGVRNITILPAFNPGTILSGDQTFCNTGNPANITLSQNPTGSGAYQWRWYFRESSNGNCPTGSTVPSGWNTNSTSQNITGTTTTGAGISFDPQSAGGLNSGRTFAVLVTPIANGGIPACGTPQWAANCRKTFVTACRIEDTTTTYQNFEAFASSVLYQNKPNPFSDFTVIEFEVSLTNTFSIVEIFSVDGKLMQKKEVNGGGKQMITIQKGTLSAGIYFYKLTTSDGFNATKRMVLVD
jgi:hypothetical protein